MAGNGATAASPPTDSMTSSGLRPASKSGGLAQIGFKVDKTVDDIKPFKVAGTKFELLEEGLKITRPTSCCCFGVCWGRLLRKYHPPETIPWDKLAKCELAFQCFKGRMTFEDQKGKKIVVTGFTYRLREAAQVVYKQMAKYGKTRTGVDADLVSTLGKRPRVIILNTGVVVKTFQGQCHGVYQQVMWSEVTMACWKGNKATISTLLPVKDATQGTVGPSHATVSVKGKADKMDQVFDVIVKNMCGSSERKMLEGDLANIKATKISNLGVMTTIKGTKYFVPWKQATNLEYCKPLCGNGSVVITDRIGNRVPLNGFGVNEYDLFREIYVKYSIGHGEIVDKDHSAIIRKGMRIAPDGVTIPVRQGCSTTYEFHPWTCIDGMEFEKSCCKGSINLITEKGKTITAASSCFGGSSVLLETLLKLRSMKYTGLSDPDAPSVTWFAGAKGSSSACALTNASIRFVAQKGRCNKIICWFDLDSIMACELFVPKHRCCSCTKKQPSYLVFYVPKEMADAMNIDDAANKSFDLESLKKPAKDQSCVIVQLKKSDTKPKELQADILKRMKARKAHEGKIGKDVATKKK